MKQITFLLIMLLVITFGYSQVIIDENFESNSIPTGWNQVALGGFHFWSFGSNVVPGSVTDFPTNAAIFDDNAAGDHPTEQNKAWLRTPWLDLTTDPNASSVIVIEYTYALNVLNTGVDTLSFVIWDNAASDWIVWRQFTDDANPTEMVEVINLNDYSGVDQTNVRFAWVFDDVESDWGWGAGVDDVKITVTPDNNSCNNAEVMTSFPYTNTQDTTGNTSSTFVTPTGCDSGMNNGVWYTFTAAGDGEFNIQSLTGGYDHEIGVYTGSCGNFTCVDNADGSIAGQPEFLSFPVTFGTQYWINFGYWQFSTAGITPGNLEVHMSYTPTDNDTCAQGQDAGAVTLPVQTNIADFASSTPYAGTVLGATDSGVAATVCEGDTGTPNDDVWFKFTATTTSTHITVEESFDSVINLFSGTCGSLSQIGCADNLDQSPVQLDAAGLTIGEEYYIRVFSFANGLNGDASFNISVWTEGGTASIQENNIAGLTLYPNPIIDLLNIEAQEEITKLSIYNQIGQLVKTITPNQTNVSVNLENLATGIYIVKIEANDKISSKRVIKK